MYIYFVGNDNLNISSIINFIHKKKKEGHLQREKNKTNLVLVQIGQLIL